MTLDEPFDLYLSSTNPKVMRYILLSERADECVRLAMYYSNVNRLEVYVDGQLKVSVSEQKWSVYIECSE